MSHWYRQSDGSPLYQVNKVGSKEMRDTTLSDARKIGLVPSVTGITGLLAKPQLGKWLTEQALLTTIEFPFRAAEEDISQYLKKIHAITKSRTDVAMNRGTEIHDKLEQYFLKGTIDQADEKILVPALNLLSYEFNGQKWIPEQSFAHKSGFGGKVDLYSKAGLIIDFKTKAKDTIDSKSIYGDDYCVQLAAYRLGLDLPRAKCYNLLISTTKPGVLYLHKWSEEELIEGLDKFNLMLALWKKLNKFDSSFSEEE